MPSFSNTASPNNSILLSALIKIVSALPENVFSEEFEKIFALLPVIFNIFSDY